MSLNPGSGSSVDLDFASVCWMHDEILGTRMSEADVIDRLSTLSDRGEELGGCRTCREGTQHQGCGRPRR